MGVNRVSRGNKGVCSVLLLSHQSLSFFNKLLEKETQVEVSRCSACTWRHLQALQGISKSVPKGKMKKVVSIFSRFYCVEGSRAFFFWPPQKSRDAFQKHGLMSLMLDCHLRAEGAAAGLVLPNRGWGCLTAQKPTQH